MNGPLNEYLRSRFPDSKMDLFAVFLERTISMTKRCGATASINQQSWMFLSSYEALRAKLLEKQVIQSLLHLGPRSFEEIGGEVVQSVAFILRNAAIHDYNSEFHRLVDGRSGEEKKYTVFGKPEKIYSESESFPPHIPGSPPIAYWATDAAIRPFHKGTRLEKK